jgi:poly(3-hydroxybutyrate) depolymerase
MIVTTSELTKASKVYIVGLSAGGAMTSNLMVQYPELFEAGAIIAGIPYPCADNLIKAISCMRSGPSSSSNELALQVIKQKSNKPHWPRISIWVGENDKVVHPNNAKVLALQWAKLSSLSEFKKHTLENEVTRQVWRNNQDEKQVELVSIGTIGHGYPINPALNNDEQAADFVLPTSISATTEILKFWRLDN